MEQEEYAKEKIIWKNIKFIDNQIVLDLIGQKPCNIMSLIDEESKFPKGTDATLLLKLNANHGPKSIYVRSVCDHAASFGIQHFAGVVMYNTKGEQKPYSVVWPSGSRLKINMILFRPQGCSKRIATHSDRISKN